MTEKEDDVVVDREEVPKFSNRSLENKSYCSVVSSPTKKDVDKHREEAVITCPETCWCWDEEAKGRQKIVSLLERSNPLWYLIEKFEDKKENSLFNTELINYADVVDCIKEFNSALDNIWFDDDKDTDNMIRDSIKFVAKRFFGGDKK